MFVAIQPPQHFDVTAFARFKAERLRSTYEHDLSRLNVFSELALAHNFGLGNVLWVVPFGEQPNHERHTYSITAIVYWDCIIELTPLYLAGKKIDDLTQYMISHPMS